MRRPTTIAQDAEIMRLLRGDKRKGKKPLPPKVVAVKLNLLSVRVVYHAIERDKMSRIN